MRQDRLYVGGERLDPVDGRLVDVINPLTEKSTGRGVGPDVEHAKDVARRIRSGYVAINQHTLDLGGPFGGFKQSGLGPRVRPRGDRGVRRGPDIPYLREPVQQ